MKKLLILILALIAVAVLGWFAIYKLKAPAIQTDIQKRSEEALASNSLDWATVVVDGRDVTLSGSAPTEQLKQHALETANVYGVRQLSDNMNVQEVAVAQVPAPKAEPVVEEPVIEEKPAAEAVVEEKSEDKPAEAQMTENKEDTGKAVAEKVADVAVAEVDIKTNAIPYAMNIVRDDAGVYVFDGVVPDPEYKQAVDAHLTSLGADPVKARWQVEVSSETPPTNWQENTLKSISALHLLKEGSVNLEGDQALLKGIAPSQDASDQAEAFAQSLSGDFTATDVDFDIASPKQVAKVVETTPIGSSKYAEKFCQTEFNGLLKQEKIQFQSGSTEVEKSSLLLLEKVAQVAARCPDHQIQIHGYTDSSGAAAANKKLSKSRAEAVMGLLASLGITEKRLLAIGHGEARPIASNKTEKGRARNRRIELIVKGLKK